MTKILLHEQEKYWKNHKKITVTLSEEHIKFIISLLSEDDKYEYKNRITSKWRENMKKDLRFLLYINGRVPLN